MPKSYKSRLLRGTSVNLSDCQRQGILKSVRTPYIPGINTHHYIHT